MAWDRFHYLCRKSNHRVKSGEEIRDAVEKTESEKDISLYGGSIKIDSVPFDFIRALKSIHKPEIFLKLTELYGRLDFSKSLEEPPKLRRVIVYLIYLAFVFYSISSIYMLKVMPSFMSMYEVFEIPPPGYLLWYIKYWTFLMLAISLLIGFSLVVGYQVKRMFKFTASKPGVSFLGFLLPRKITRSYSRIIEIASFPLAEKLGRPQYPRTSLSDYLFQIEKSGLDLATEMKVLICQEGARLARHSERFIQFIAVIIAVLMILSIFLFLNSAYAPIFVLGDSL